VLKSFSVHVLNFFQYCFKTQFIDPLSFVFIHMGPQLRRKYAAMALRLSVLVLGFILLISISFYQVCCFCFLDTIISLLQAQVPIHTLLALHTCARCGGYRLDSNMKVGMVKEALKMALKNRRHSHTNIIHHSDRGYPVLLSRLLGVCPEPGHDLKHYRKI
jgi:hypothetical protein